MDEDEEWSEDLYATALAELADPMGACEPPAELDAIRPCGSCGGAGMKAGRRKKHDSSLCDECEGVGWFGIDSFRPTQARPGTEDKVAVMAQRYRDGRPLWDEQDATYERTPR